MICTDSITIVRAPTVTDRHHNEIRDWAHATRTTVDNLSVQPQRQEEPQGFQRGREGDLREVTVTTWLVISAKGIDVDVLSTDRVELTDGTPCVVSGQVGRFETGITAGDVHHVEFHLERVEG